ncbi:MAG: methyltransferase [Deltaproteobacteria bacterium]|nr:methyltransferase [Deltaproteobacteria bacterium]
MRRRPAGWEPPGPVPPGDRGDPSLRRGPGETLDCLSGHWKIFQLRRGHRYSTDDLLTAWYAVEACRRAGVRPRRVLDLGCGIGSVGLLVLWKFPGAALVGVEAQAVSAGLARRSVRYNGIEGRAEIRVGDFRDPGVFDAGERFDLVTGSPPYLAPGEGRRSSLPQRGPCRFEDRGGARDYLRAASARLEAEGIVVWVHATRYRHENVAAAVEAGLGRIAVRPVVFREGRKSLISLFWASQGAAPARVEEEPALVVRGADGVWSDEYRRIRTEMGFPA